jgi:hypothetical protein
MAKVKKMVSNNLQVGDRYRQVEVTSELLNQIWDNPQQVGGGAKTFRAAGGTCYQTAEGWGFYRIGSRSFGQVWFVDPCPGRGAYKHYHRQGFQLPSQTPYPHGKSIVIA